MIGSITPFVLILSIISESRFPSYAARDNWAAIPKALEDETAHIYREYIYNPDIHDFQITGHDSQRDR